MTQSQFKGFRFPTGGINSPAGLIHGGSGRGGSGRKRTWVACKKAVKAFPPGGFSFSFGVSCFFQVPVYASSTIRRINTVPLYVSGRKEENR